MKKATKYILIGLLIFCSESVFGQNHTEYVYDAAGNRIQRKVIILTPKPKTESLEQVAPLTDSKGDYTFNLYPNPTQGEVQIEADATFMELPQAMLRVYDMNGKQLSEQPFSSNRQLVDLSGEMSGSYVIRITASGYSNEWRIIKQ